MIRVFHVLARAPRFRQFLRFCLVGASGVVVDMAVLHGLVAGLGWPAALGKLAAAQTALLNNFLWNELWTFRRAVGAGGAPAPTRHGWRGVLGRLGRFEAICVGGLGLALLSLHGLHVELGVNLYLANLLAIGLATAWNFGLNAWLTWPARPAA